MKIRYTVDIYAIKNLLEKRIEEHRAMIQKDQAKIDEPEGIIYKLDRAESVLLLRNNIAHSEWYIRELQEKLDILDLSDDGGVAVEDEV